MASRLNKAAIIDLAGQGMTISDIAKSQDASYAGVFNFCKTNNIVVRKATKLTIDQVREDIVNGLSQGHIGRKYDVSLGAVSNFMRVNGLTQLYKDHKLARPKIRRGAKATETAATETVTSETVDTTAEDVTEDETETAQTVE